MPVARYIALFYFFCTPFILCAQANPFTGTWKMDYPTAQASGSVHLEIQVGVPEKNLLFPAHLLLQSGTFKGAYDFLLLKKTTRELAFSRNKKPVEESPFSLKDYLFLLNGCLSYSYNLKGAAVLTLNRSDLKPLDLKKADWSALLPEQGNTLKNVYEFLKTADIRLTKTNEIPWESQHREEILNSGPTTYYWGINDTAHVFSHEAKINLTDGKASSKDVASASLNGHNFIDHVELNKKKYSTDILLDSGVNYIAFFSEQAGNGLQNLGKMEIETAQKKINLDFGSRLDSAADFIVAKIYYIDEVAKETRFQDNIFSTDNKPLNKNEKLICDIIATSKQVKFAIWDDAAEDGDSVSLNIDGAWFIKNLFVKKTPQFFTVTLKPGRNTITFIAENLGSIPPNTSVLEIIEGKKRKSFNMSTNPGENNLIRIYYDPQPGTR